MFVLCNNECLLMGNISVVSVQEGSWTAAEVIIQKGRAHLLKYKERDSSCNNMVQVGGGGGGFMQRT